MLHIFISGSYVPYTLLLFCVIPSCDIAHIATEFLMKFCAAKKMVLNSFSNKPYPHTVNHVAQYDEMRVENDRSFTKNKQIIKQKHIFYNYIM